MRLSDLPLPSGAKELLEENGLTELWPPQEDAIKLGVLEGQSLVLASPTASGKTLIAELCALKHVLEQGGKVLYLAPLRALASEKYEDFQKYFKRFGDKMRIAISTGDYDSSDPSLGKYDVIFSTNEKADSLLRHRSPWIGEVSLVVADEIHLLNDMDRGPTLEVTLTRLKHINPKMQLLALSATIRNAAEIAEWLKADSMTTNWRPVKLRECVYLNGGMHCSDGSAFRIPVTHKSPVVSIVLNNLKNKGQALVFTETRKVSYEMAKKIAAVAGEELTGNEKRNLKMLGAKALAAGERTRLNERLSEVITDGVAFHHAGLSPAHRRIVEDNFRNGRIKVLCATPTLAAGVNLPARVVVINSFERYESGYGKSPISVLEYKQMAGRAGRPKYDTIGESVLIARTEDEQDFLMEKYVIAEPEKIWSKLAVESALRSHVLATIASGFASTDRALFDFFEKSFYAHQYGSTTIKSLIGRVMKFLSDEAMIEYDITHLCATKFGRRVSELYLDPVSAVIIRNCLKENREVVSNIGLLHMICHTPDMVPKPYLRKREMDEIEIAISKYQPQLLVRTPDPWAERDEYEKFVVEMKTTLVLNDWIAEVHEDDLITRYGVEPGDLFRMVSNSDWLLYASHELGRLFERRPFLPHISRLRQRVKYGVTEELVFLTKLEGVGRVRARVLFNAGFRKIDDLRRASIKELLDVPMIGSRVAKRIKDQVGGLVKPEEWRSLEEKAETSQSSLTEF